MTSHACLFRIPPMFGLDGDVCGATAVVRFTVKEDSWPLQYACADHRAAKRAQMEEDHPGETIVETFLGNQRGYVSDEDEAKFDRLLTDPFGR